MPFTPSHVAAALPLKGWLGPRADFAALAIGSMAPDLPYFLGLPLERAATHSLPGVLWFGLPMGLLTLLTWRSLLRRPARMLAPQSFGRRIPLAPPPAPTPVVAASSVALGALTHVLWDAFTHGNGFAVEELPILGQSLGSLPTYELHAYRFLQHGSTLLGGVALIVAARRWRERLPALVRDDGVHAGTRQAARLATLLLPPLAGLAYALSTTPLVASLFYVRLFVGRGVVAAISTALLLLVVLGVLERAGALGAARVRRA